MRALRVGVVGLGSWGLEHLRAWLTVPGARVVAICDRDEQRLCSACERFGVERSYSTAASMALEADLDVVSVAGGEADRLETARPFFDEGVHALVEKPLGLDLESALELVRVAAARGVMFMTGHVLRFDPRFAALKQRVDEGALGPVRSVYARRLNLHSAREKYGRAHPALMAQIHDLDLACWFFDSAPTSVRAHEVHDPGSDGSGAPRVLWTNLEFPEGIAVAEHAWALPDHAGVWLESETEVIGTAGLARLRSPSDGLEILSPTGHEHLDPAFAALGEALPAIALKEQLSYFARCVASDCPPTRLTPEDGLRAHAVALAVAESARTGQSVQPVAIDTYW
jgi:UDP-N-acetylglucosamine 3-dehydrogenase